MVREMTRKYLHYAVLRENLKTQSGICYLQVDNPGGNRPRLLLKRCLRTAAEDDRPPLFINIG